MFPIVEHVNQSRRDNWKQSPQHSNRASEIGHVCLRYLTYRRTHWKDALKPPDFVLGIFEDGNMHEDAVNRVLMGTGKFAVIEGQRPYVSKQYNLTGHSDGKIVDLATTQRAILEIKSINEFTWRAIDEWRDFLRWEVPHWARKYPYQIQTYMWLDEEDLPGVFILKNKSTGALKEIWVERDEGIITDIKNRANLVNVHVKSGTLPERITYEEKICGSCQFRDVCLPEKHLKGIAEFIDDNNLLGILRAREGMKPFEREYKALDETAKGRFQFEEGQVIVCNEFQVKSKRNKKGSMIVRIKSLKEIESEGTET